MALKWTPERVGGFLRDLREIAANNNYLPEGTFEAFHAAHGSMAAVEVAVEKDKKIFLVHRTDERWNGWHIPGGYIQSQDESVEAACNRVAEREIGCRVRLKRILEVYKWKPGNHPYGYPTSIVCVCEPLSEIETSDSRKFFGRAPDHFLADCHRQFVEKYFDSGIN